VSSAYSVVLLSAGEIAQLRWIEFFHCCVLLLLNDYSLFSDTQMDNRSLVTRQLGGVPSKNHHGDLKSTPPKKSAAQKFRPAGPIRAKDTNRTTRINISHYQQNATRLKAL
jgi:hypothetical protein